MMMKIQFEQEKKPDQIFHFDGKKRRSFTPANKKKRDKMNSRDSRFWKFCRFKSSSVDYYYYFTDAV